ncbi:MAG TPA: hypothetical protein VEH04_08310 [Verrucomicrobiae bacterium]|nr:hypothetical protein [Verrucomicrobiae bacterium]
MQFVVALMAAWAVVWFVNSAWCPIVSRAIDRLPETGQIRGGILHSPETEPRFLAESRMLAFSLDLLHTGLARVPAHVQVEFGRRDVHFRSLLGTAFLHYRNDYTIEFNRTALEPWWGAWRPPLLWILFGSVLFGLIATWWMLALAYSIPLWIAALLRDRRMGWASSWKLASASFIPGALMMIVGIFAYGFGVISLVEFLVLQVIHWIVGWAYCIGGLLARPPASDVVANPFDIQKKGVSVERDAKPKNPFSPPSANP